MALDQSGLLEVLDALRAAVVGDRVRQAAETVYRALIEAELTDTIGAALHERTESRISLPNGHRTRILSTTAGDRAPSSSASAARSRSRPTNDVNRAAGLGRSASSGGAVGSAVREGAAMFGSQLWAQRCWTGGAPITQSATYLELGELPDSGVGGEGLKPPPIHVGEGELGSGMGSFAAYDHPHPRRPSSRGEITEPVGGHENAPTVSRSFPSLKVNRAQLQAIIDDLAPGLTSRRGIGPVSAAHAIVSFSHPGRCRNDAAFAALGGVSPLQASSGRTVRHRLNRGGDRALNRAIHIIAMTRTRCCPTTRSYITRRTVEGKTPRRSGAASSGTSPASSTAPSPPP